jgi:molybdopterin synthase sulfur carrier subunit
MGSDSAVANPPESTFTILYFAAASTYTNKSSELLPAPQPVSSLFASLESRYPGITAKVLKSCAVTVNLEYVDMQQEDSANPTSDDSTENDRGIIIQAGDEIGIIPPVSSG